MLLLDEPVSDCTLWRSTICCASWTSAWFRGHQVIYSTHSPFMVATTALERVRTVEDRDSEGTRVSQELFDHSNDTRLPLQAALCHELARFLPAGKGTLLVEQPSDQVY